jgi:hypothetical protein
VLLKSFSGFFSHPFFLGRLVPHNFPERAAEAFFGFVQAEFAGGFSRFP